MKRKARVGDGNYSEAGLDESPTFGRALAATADPMAFLRAVQASQLAHPSGSSSDQPQASQQPKKPPVPVQAAHSLFIEGQLLLPPGLTEKAASTHVPPMAFSSAAVAQPPHAISSANSEPTSPDLVAFLQGVPFKVGGDTSEPASPLSPELLAGLAHGLQGSHHYSGGGGSHDGLLPSAHGLFASGMERLSAPDSGGSVGAVSFTMGVNGVGSALSNAMGRSTSPGFSAESVFIDEVTDDSSGHEDNNHDEENDDEDDDDLDDGTASEYAESLGLDDAYRSFDDADASSDYSCSRDDQDDVESLLDGFGSSSSSAAVDNLGTSGMVPSSMSALSLQGLDLSPGLVGGGGFQQHHCNNSRNNNGHNANTNNTRRRSNSSCSSASSSGVVALSSRTVNGSSKGRHRAPSVKVREAEETSASLLARSAAHASTNGNAGGRSSNRSSVSSGKRRKVSPDARKPPVAETDANSSRSSDGKDASADRSKSKARPSRSQGAAAKKALNLEALKSQIASLQAKEELHANRPKLGAHASATLRKQDAAAAAATATALSTEAADVRRSVVAAFFQLRTSRGGASTDATTWAELVNSDAFTLTLPRTPYRAVPAVNDAKAKAAKGQAGSKAAVAAEAADKEPEQAHEQVNEGGAETPESSCSGRVLKGIPSLVADCASLASLADGLRAACRSRFPEANKGGRRSAVHSVGLKYELESSSEDGGGSSSSGLLAQGDVLMGSWRGSTVGVAACAEVEATAAAAANGGSNTAAAGGVKAAATKVEATVEGMVRCRFDESHKLVAVELTFDAASFSRQLQKLGLSEACRLGQAHRSKRSGGGSSNSKAGNGAGNATNSSSGGGASGSTGGASSAGLLAPSGFAGLLRPALGSRGTSVGTGGARPGTLPLPPLSAMTGLTNGAPVNLLLAPALIGGANGAAANAGPTTSSGGASGNTNLQGPLPSAAFMRDFARATQLARAECGNQTPSPQQVHLKLLALQMQAVGQQQQQPTQVPLSTQGQESDSSKPASLAAAPAALALHAPFLPSAFTEVGPGGSYVKAIPNNTNNNNKRLKVVAASPRGCAVATPSPPSEAPWSLANGTGKLPSWPASSAGALASVAPAAFSLPITSSMPLSNDASTKSELLSGASQMAQ